MRTAREGRRALHPRTPRRRRSRRGQWGREPARSEPQRARTRRSAPSESAVSEVLGYILMLFLSSALLALSLQAFLQSKTASDDIQAGQELRLVADRIAGQVQQAGLIATELPNATYTAQVQLPAIAGRAYYVNITGSQVYANTTDGKIQAQSSAFQIAAIGNTNVYGTVYGSQGSLKVQYAMDANGVKNITIIPS